MKRYKNLLSLAGIVMFLSAFSLADTGTIIVPLGGNSWLTVKAKNGNEKVTNNGWEKWQHATAVFSTYVKIAKQGSFKLSAPVSVPEGESMIRCTINGKAVATTVYGATEKEYELGEWNLPAGYVKIDIQGIRKTGTVFANLHELVISGSSVDAQAVYVKNNEGNYFYWGRRGPSVHINYDLSAAGNEIEWFYNEIKVPVGSDPIGSYFMANGFKEGYFGIQVNSATERRVLFSIWSPFTTDDPAKIPDDQKIRMLKKGEQVHAGEFGNEGSGGQSYLKYDWKAGQTCKFLLHAQPDTDQYTTYTAYFYAPTEQKWLLIASFKRPHTNTYLTRLHSFLENFDPLMGNMVRKAFYQNQWVRTKSGEWIPLSKMTFTGDATAQKGYRVDYGGGEENGAFFLRNGGFFNDNTALKTVFTHEPGTTKPDVDLSALQ
jgi:hypothetical protein